MKFIVLISNYFGNMKFRTKLVITYILLISIPLFIISYKYYNTSMKILSDMAGQNVYEIVKQNNQILDAKLSKIESDSLNMINDRILFKEIENTKFRNDYMLMQMDRKLSDVIDKYLGEDDYYSANIVTSYYAFGRSSLSVPYGKFSESEIYKKAVKADGGLQWIPTYDFAKMFHVGYLDKINLDFKYLFSAARMLNCTYAENGAIMSLDQSIEKPILIINFKEDLFDQTFENSIPIEGAYYFVLDKYKHIISHSNKNKIGTYEKANWLNELFKNGSGIRVVNIDGKKMIVCYDTSKVTGWLSVVAISPDSLVSKLMPTMKSYTLNLLWVLVVISIIVAYIISGSITKPLQKLLLAMKKTGEGNFDTKIQESSRGEVGYLISKFNHMNEKIRLLIDENYMTKIREKETEIMALNIQLNPHFLYNTLNIINWLAIENEQKEISKLLVSLSAMLQYTAHNNSEVERFEDDFLWLKNYIYIMTCRFEGKFTVDYDIDPRLLEYKVPKLFLQPFIENSIIHGFESIENGGVIRISGLLEENKVIFCVEDNGQGICEMELSREGKGNKTNIGIKNVDRRIKLIYGKEYGVTIQSKSNIGTIVKVILPNDII